MNRITFYFSNHFESDDEAMEKAQEILQFCLAIRRMENESRNYLGDASLTDMENWAVDLLERLGWTRP